MSFSRRTFLTSSAAGAAAIALPTLTTARQPATPADATPVANASDREARVIGVMEQHGIPGAIILLDSPETGLWKAALGEANIETREPMTTDMHMRIGSITKTFTATMVLQLVDQGVMALEDTLAVVYPELADIPNADTMTIRHLLSMQSGLVDPEFPGALDEGEPGIEPGPAYTPDEILGLVADQPTAFAPGEGGMYSNINYLILGMIAEHRTGTPWRDLVRTGILVEAGLENTSLPETPDMPAPASSGYAFPPQDSGVETHASPAALAEPVDVTNLSPLVSGSSGSMISTLDDLHAWMSVLWEGTLLNPDLQDARFDFSRATDLQGFSYGLGVGSIDGMVGHTGNIDGFSSVMFYLPERATTVIAMANVYPAPGDVDTAMLLIESLLAG